MNRLFYCQSCRVVMVLDPLPGEDYACGNCHFRILLEFKPEVCKICGLSPPVCTCGKENKKEEPTEFQQNMYREVMELRRVVSSFEHDMKQLGTMKQHIANLRLLVKSGRFQDSDFD